MKTDIFIQKNWKIILGIFICESSGIISSFLSMDKMYPWFTTLQKPSWNPPAFLFAPVWTILFLLMGISLGIIWKSDAPKNLKSTALSFFVLQLVLNFFWSIFFFRFHSPSMAFLDIILLLFAILFTIFSFSRISKTASWLLIPYISWVTFAAILNYCIWILNK